LDARRGLGLCRCIGCKTGRPCAGELERYESAVQAPDPGRQIIARGMAMLAYAVPARWVGWFPVTPRGEELPGNIALLSGPLRSSPEVGREEYAKRYYRDDPFAPRRFLDSRRPVVTMDDIGGDLALSRTGYGGELLPELGLKREAAIYLRDGGTMLGFIGFARTEEEGEFQSNEIAFLHRSQPLLELSYNRARLPQPEFEHAELLQSSGLTPRQIEVAKLAATGAKNAQIAATLMISEATVKTHLIRVFAAIGVRSRTQLALRLAPERGNQPFG
jgi:DNA-binding CsgD family transcriptional regulator